MFEGNVSQFSYWNDFLTGYRTLGSKYFIWFIFNPQHISYFSIILLHLLLLSEVCVYMIPISLHIICLSHLWEYPGIRILHKIMKYGLFAIYL